MNANFARWQHCQPTAPIDPLAMPIPGRAFISEHPAMAPGWLPVALLGDGTPWTMPLVAHTLAIGGVGVGKTTALAAMLGQLTPHVALGAVQAFGIDLHQDFIATAMGPVASTPTDAAAVLAQVVHTMAGRQHHTAGMAAHPLSWSPPVVLVVDDLDQVIQCLRRAGSSQALADLQSIMVMGNALGVTVLASASDPGPLRPFRANFAQAVLMRQDSPYWNDHFLGPLAQEAGFDSTALPRPIHSNNYAGAGLAVTLDQGGSPVRVRFPHVTREDLEALAATVAKTPTPVSPEALLRAWAQQQDPTP